MASKSKTIIKNPQEPQNPCEKDYEHLNAPPYTWHPSVGNKQQIDYVRRLECEYETLQSALLTVTSQMARLQFRIRQIISAAPSDRSDMIANLERVVFKEFHSLSQCQEELPLVERHHQEMGDIKDRQHALIKSLRLRIHDFRTASEHLPMKVDLDPEWETYQAKACSCPIPSEPPNCSYCRTKKDLEASITASRKTGGREYNWQHSTSKSSQTDITFGRRINKISNLY